MQDFARGVDRLRARYRVTYDQQISARAGYLAGDDARRLRELEDAIDDPDVDAIVAARGGYGAMRIASSIDPARVAAHPKLLVGFSDVTALHALWARAGVCSLHASMVAALGRGSDAMLARWIDVVEGKSTCSFEGLTPIGASRAVIEAPVIGGNLALLAAMTGTPLAPPLDGAILFVEDVGEAPYRVDRMLTQLRLSGALENVAGVLVGSFTRCAPGADGTTVESVVAERLGDLDVPVLVGLPCGHVEEPLELPLGARARIDGTRGCVTFVEPLVHL
ncbi:Muramoyltetrapeptide carboxypeptidase [Sandaracinus amylolyticus]|nr:Muramoyltetrapeptide carboxypeptidase [Sandaracinus amylolyticus]